MTFHTLIERAIQQSLDDLSVLIERKIVAMFGEDAVPPARAKTTARRARVRAKRPATPKPTTNTMRSSRPTAAKSASAKTTATRDEAALRDRVLAALDGALAPMSRSQLIAAIDVRPSEEARFATALVRLRADKLIVLEGLRRHAAYRCATIGESSPPTAPIE